MPLRTRPPADTLDLPGLLAAGAEPEAIRSALGDFHPASIADTVETLEPGLIAQVLAALPANQAAEVFGYFAMPLQGRLLRAMGRGEVGRLVAALPHDERADLYKRLSPAEQEALLPGLAQAERDDIRRLAAYAEGTAGAVMTSDYVTLEPGLSVAEAIQKLRREAPDRETIYDSYIVDADRRLVGVLSLRDLLLSPDDAVVGDIMRREVVFARVDEPREDVARRIADFDLLVIPVVDASDVLVGIVTVDDALDVVEAEDLRKLTGFGGTSAMGGPELDVVESSFGEMFGKRFFWLAVLTVFGIVTSTFVAAQEELLAEAVILAAFIAPIIDMGGNTGSQTATLVIRSMALGQVRLRARDFAFLLRRDLPVAAALGLSIALLEVVLARITKNPGWEVLTIVAISMFVVTLVGSLFGLLLPFVARWLKTDPATLSAPMITSIMDLAGVGIYFAFAYAFLGDRLTAT
jgi:magnesium transporter